MKDYTSRKAILLLVEILRDNYEISKKDRYKIIKLLMED